LRSGRVYPSNPFAALLNTAHPHSMGSANAVLVGGNLYGLCASGASAGDGLDRGGQWKEWLDLSQHSFKPSYYR
jgi:hypothetical protein